MTDAIVILDDSNHAQSTNDPRTNVILSRTNTVQPPDLRCEGIWGGAGSGVGTTRLAGDRA